MILKTYPNKNLYGKYFLATEAPDDEEVTEEQPKPRRNVKVITVKPSNRGKDFTVAGDPPIDPETVETNNEIDSDDTNYDIPDETTVDEIPPEETPEDTGPEVTNQGEQPDESNMPTTDEPETTDDTIDYSQDNDGQSDDTDTTVDAPDTGGADDFSDTGDASATDTASVQTDGAPADTNNTPVKLNAPGVELDSTRKYNLYREFMSLYNACDNYISKLENILRNDYDENQIILISVNNLREIKDIVSDYMTIRFQINTYVQSLLFYQKMIVAVQLVFKLLKSINSKKN